MALPITGGLLRSNDITASSQVVYNLLNSSGTQRTLTFDRTNDWWQWGPNTNIYFSGTDQRIGLGTSPAQTHLDISITTTRHGMASSSRPALHPTRAKRSFDTQVAGIPRLRVENSRTIVNNGSDLVGYSDDRATQKWKITGATGTIQGSTINATSGFQVGGAALNFSNLSGTVDTTEVASGNKTGTGTKFATGTGTYTSGDCVKIDANGNLVDNGSACAAGGDIGQREQYDRDFPEFSESRLDIPSAHVSKLDRFRLEHQRATIYVSADVCIVGRFHQHHRHYERRHKLADRHRRLCRLASNE